MVQSDTFQTALAKIRSSALQRQVMDETGTPLVVVVEVVLPRQTFDVMKERDGGDFRVARLQWLGHEPDGAEAAQRFFGVRRDIESITGKPPESVLELSGSMVVEANGEQIRKIAALPSVAAIWANEGNVPS